MRIAKTNVMICLRQYLHIGIGLLLMYGCSDSNEKLIERALTATKSTHVLVVSKKHFLLSVYDARKRLVARYRIAYGLNPDKKPKQFAGDNRTPEGLYRIVEMLSMDADEKTDSYRKIAAMNKVVFRARNGHAKYSVPKTDLGDNVYGPRFFLIDYPNADDRKRYREAIDHGLLKTDGPVPDIGSGIAIHGNNDPDSIGHCSSNGCIRMYNTDIVELDAYIRLGTPVIIGAD